MLFRAEREYLCDDALAHGEQTTFLAYMRLRYKNRQARARIYEVLSCLARAGLIDGGRGGLLGSLSSNAEWAKASESEPAEKYDAERRASASDS